MVLVEPVQLVAKLNAPGNPPRERNFELAPRIELAHVIVTDPRLKLSARDEKEDEAEKEEDAPSDGEEQDRALPREEWPPLRQPLLRDAVVLERGEIRPSSAFVLHFFYTQLFQ